MVLPLYEHLLTQLKAVRTDHLPQLAHGIDASIAALEKYMAESRKTNVYALAMGKFLSLSLLLMLTPSNYRSVINPTIKFKWLEKYWTSEEVSSAEESVVAAVSHQTSLYTRTLLMDSDIDASISSSPKECGVHHAHAPDLHSSSTRP